MDLLKRFNNKGDELLNYSTEDLTSLMKIYFTKDEFIVLKILSKQYLELKNKNKPKPNIKKDFDKYLDKKNK